MYTRDGILDNHVEFSSFAGIARGTLYLYTLFESRRSLAFNIGWEAAHIMIMSLAMHAEPTCT